MRHTTAYHYDRSCDRLLGYITRYIMDRGYAPSLRDMQRALDLSTTSIVRRRLQRLIERKQITMEPGVPRSIRVIEMPTRII